MVSARSIYAFIWLDIKDWLSYKYEVFFWMLNIVVGAVTYAYVGSNVSLRESFALLPYGGNFLAFLLVGMAFNDFIVASLNAPREVLNPWMLEWKLMMPCSLLDAILGSIWFRYMVSTIQLAVYFAFGLFFGVQYEVNWVATILVLVVGMAALWGFGLISASIQIITKRWDPVVWLFTTMGWLLGGVWFPVQFLPDALRSVSAIMPQTYILDMLRRSLLTGTSIVDMLAPLSNLLLLAVAIDTLGVLMIRWGIGVAKRQGTVGYY